MDRVTLLQLEEAYSETLIPVLEDDKIVAYPIYEPLKVTNVYLFSDAATPLIPLEEGDYEVNGDKIYFNS